MMAGPRLHSNAGQLTAASNRLYRTHRFAVSISRVSVVTRDKKTDGYDDKSSADWTRFIMLIGLFSVHFYRASAY